MTLEQVPTLVMLLMLLALACSPKVYAWARNWDNAPQPASPAPADPTTVPGIMTPRQAVAYHLYGQAVAWDPAAMLDYDSSAQVQDTWLAEADRRLARRRPRLRVWS